MANPEKEPPDPVIENPWQGLRAYTDARIGLGRAGISLPTRQQLDFQLCHARARDAVHLPLDIPALTEGLAALLPLAPIALHSQAVDRHTYLQRPDLGRRLDEASRTRLAERAGATTEAFDLALVVVDGLSSLGIQSHALPFIKALLADLARDRQDWTLAPPCMVEQGRVAIGDEIGSLLNARCVVVLIGERPGLSSPDSVGLYLTWNPRLGLTDAARNCISNVRPAGLVMEEASRRLLYLLKESRRLSLSGVQLKDRTEDPVIEQAARPGNFLLS